MCHMITSGLEVSIHIQYGPKWQQGQLTKSKGFPLGWKLLRDVSETPKLLQNKIIFSDS